MLTRVYCKIEYCGKFTVSCLFFGFVFLLNQFRSEYSSSIGIKLRESITVLRC